MLSTFEDDDHREDGFDHGGSESAGEVPASETPQESIDRVLREATARIPNGFEGVKQYTVDVTVETQEFGDVVLQSDPQEPHNAVRMAFEIEQQHQVTNVAVVDLFSGVHVIPDVAMLIISQNQTERLAA